MKLFKVLLVKELATGLSPSSKGRKKDVPGMVVSALISLAFLTLFVYLFVAFEGEFARLGIAREVLVIFVAVAVIAEIALGIARTSRVLFGGEDAKVILPLPISTLTMLSAKLVALCIKEFFNSLFFLGPMLIAYGVMRGAGAVYYINAVLAVVFVSVATVGIMAILSPLFVYVKKFFLRYPVLVLIASLVFFGGVFGAYSYILGVTSDLLMGGRLQYIFNSANSALLARIASWLLFSGRVVAMLESEAWGYVAVIGVTAVLAVAAYFASSGFYLYYLKSAGSRKSGAVRRRPNRVRGVNGSLIVKELIQVFGNPSYLVSYLSVIITLPLLSYITLTAMDELISKLLGRELLLPLSILILVMFSSVGNTFAGDVISREQNRIMIMKTIPVSYKKQIACKVGIALVIAAASDVVTLAVLTIAGVFEPLEGLLLLLITLFATFASILRLVSKDINRPTPNKGDENANVTLAVIRSLLLSCVLGGICFGVYAIGALYRGGNPFLSGIVKFTAAVGGMNGLMAIVAALCLADAAVSVLLLCRRLDDRMKRIKI